MGGGFLGEFVLAKTRCVHKLDSAWCMSLLSRDLEGHLCFFDELLASI